MTTALEQSPSEQIHVHNAPFVLEGQMTTPGQPVGVIIIPRGSTKAHDEKDLHTWARHLNACGYATVLVKLLTDEEHHGGQIISPDRFDVNLVAGRLLVVLDWVQRQGALKSLPVGIAATNGTGAAAMLAATERSGDIRAIVVLDGHPELAETHWNVLQVPTRMVMSTGFDGEYMRSHEAALAGMSCTQKDLVLPADADAYDPAGSQATTCWALDTWFTKHLH